ncbi:LD-carboxypeptidase [Myroides sp. N17-2]|uniref:S66 peptidase family protein n=1 Tax=Myroides sp. N17-2 TaxID=2030799 RepID=UPI000EFBEED2|nr:LD-carboxypeptidase [Myroides sp. N17-2]
MIRPDYLKKGDKVAIVCTARKFSKEEAELAIELMNSWGLEVVLGDTIGLDNYQLGGTDQQRADDFTKQLKDPEIKAIWCARGGYGTVRIIDDIDFTGFVDHPKWIVGFSDVTVLHSHIHNLGVETIHGIMAFSVAKSLVDSRDSLYRALFGQEISYTIHSDRSNKIGQGQGELVGGNLSILYSLLGSVSSMNTEGKILFIEDLDEYLYHLDRMLHNLKRNGLLSGLAGLVVGGMTDMHDNAIPFGYDAKQIILSITAEYDYPIVFDFPAGHGEENLALNLGREVKLEVNQDRTQLTFL